MTDRWSEDFVPSDVQDNIICLDELDHQEREGYTVNLQHGNYENDLQAAQDETFDNSEDAVFTTGSVSTDINGERQDPNIRMLNTLFDVVTERLHPPRTPGSGANDSATMPLPLGSNPQSLHTGFTELQPLWTIGLTHASLRLPFPRFSPLGWAAIWRSEIFLCLYPLSQNGLYVITAEGTPLLCASCAVTNMPYSSFFTTAGMPATRRSCT
jgi:hypothetical protein